MKNLINIATVRKANKKIIEKFKLNQESLSETYDGNINVSVNNEGRVFSKSFDNQAIKLAYQKALINYAQKV